MISWPSIKVCICTSREPSVGSYLTVVIGAVLEHPRKIQSRLTLHDQYHTHIKTSNQQRRSITNSKMCFGSGGLGRRYIYREEVLIAPRPVRYSTSHGHSHSHHHGHTHRHSTVVTGQRVHETRRPASRVYVQAPLTANHGSRHSVGGRRAVPVAVVTETRRRSQVLR